MIKNYLEQQTVKTHFLLTPSSIFYVSLPNMSLIYIVYHQQNTQSWLLKVVLRKQCMSCRIFVEMQKTIFILNFGPDFFARHLDNFTSKSFFFATDTSNTISGFPDCVKRNWRKRKCLMWAHANILTCSCTVLSPNDWFSPQGAILHKERSFILQMNTRLRSSLLAHIFQGPGAHSSGVLFD